MLGLATNTALAARAHRIGVPWALVGGLVLSAGGDALMTLGTRSGLLSGMAMFGGAHTCYLADYVRAGTLHHLTAHPYAVGLHVIAYVALAVVLWRRLGSLRWYVLGYGALLFAAAVAAWATHPWRGVGASLFACSDVMIALRLAGLRFRGQEPLIHLTYVLGQVLIAHRWSR